MLKRNRNKKKHMRQSFFIALELLKQSALEFIYMLKSDLQVKRPIIIVHMTRRHLYITNNYQIWVISFNSILKEKKLYIKVSVWITTSNDDQRTFTQIRSCIYMFRYFDVLVIQLIHLAGFKSFCWNRLSVNPLNGIVL